VFRIALPRRDFLIDATVSLGGLGASVLRRIGLAAANVPVYVLSPTYPDDGPYCGGCRSCKACRRHADNKVFATLSAADKGRAHGNCDCAIVQRSLPQGTWVALFGNQKHPHTLSVDRRNRRVAILLKRF
jgi:hypothetical protein